MKLCTVATLLVCTQYNVLVYVFALDIIIQSYVIYCMLEQNGYGKLACNTASSLIQFPSSFYLQIYPEQMSEV